MAEAQVAGEKGTPTDHLHDLSCLGLALDDCIGPAGNRRGEANEELLGDVQEEGHGGYSAIHRGVRSPVSALRSSSLTHHERRAYSETPV